MKKFLCLFVTFCMIFTIFSLPAFADDQNSSTNNEPQSDDGEVLNDAISYTCTYDHTQKRVVLSGSLNNEIFSDYGGWSLCVYDVPIGASEYDVVKNAESKPLAETLISKKFEFSLKAEEVRYRYSSYAIFLRSPEGETVLAARAQYPEVKSSFMPENDMRGYKGISSEFSSFVSEVDAGTLILPVYIDDLFSDASSNIFVLADGKQYFFNKKTVEDLDVAINSTTVSGAKVYLRLIYENNNPEDETSYEYSVPFIDKGDELVKLHAVISFLSERYGAREKCKISGFVLGNAWNDPRDIASVSSFEHYVMHCGAYAIVVSNAARTIDPTLDIVIPFKGEGFLATDGSKTESQELIEAFFAYLDTYLYRDLNCSLIVSSQHTPFGINNVTQHSVIDVEAQEPTNTFCAGEQKQFSAYLDRISRKYGSCPEDYIFEWTPTDILKDNALSAVYAYSYHSLLADNAVRAFVVKANENNAENLRGIKQLLKLVDAHEGSDLTKYFTSFFGKESWGEIVGTKSDIKTSIKHYFSVASRLNTSESFLGEFRYFDPLDTNDAQNWFLGNQCIGIKSDITERGTKVLKADLSFSDTQDYAEILYVFEYSENMIHTKDLRFKFDLNDEADGALYELKFTLGNSKNKLESSCIVKGNSVNEIFVDVSKCVTASTVDFMKISVRSLDGKSQMCSIRLSEICGLSNEYTSDELGNLISAEREKIREQEFGENEKVVWTQLALAIGVVFVVGVLGLAIFAGFRREDREEREETEDGEDKNSYENDELSDE